MKLLPSLLFLISVESFNILEVTLKNTEYYSPISQNDCNLNMIKRYISLFNKFYVSFQDGLKHERFLRKLQNQVLNTIYTNGEIVRKTKPLDKFHLRIFTKDITIEDIMAMNPGPGTKFLVFVNDLEDITKVLTKFWKFKFSDVVVSFLDHGVVHYYSFQPYTAEHCSVVVPKLTGLCAARTGDITYAADDLFDSSYETLFGCLINITLSPFYPAVYKGENGQLTGWEVETLKVLVEDLNGIPNFQLFDPTKHPKYEGGFGNGYINLLGDSDIAGGLAMTVKNVIKTDYVTYGTSLCATWIVPRCEVTSYSLKQIFQIFTKELWFAIGLCFILVFILAKRVDKSISSGTTALVMICHLVGIAYAKLPLRNILGQWLCFAFIINAIFLCQFQSRILVPTKPQQIETNEGVFKAGFKVAGYSELLDDLLPSVTRNQMKPTSIIPITKYNQILPTLEKIAVKRDIAYLTFKEVTQSNLEKYNVSFRTKLHFQKSCLVRYPLVFVLKQNSALTKSFLQSSRHLSESGLSERIMQSFTNIKQQSLNIAPKALKLKQLIGAFVILSVGLILAALVFLGEILVKDKLNCFKNNKKQSNVIAMKKIFNK